ncbi:MAG: MBL fold metallo-hydrolase [Gammaproteobacteria bacterium]
MMKSKTPENKPRNTAITFPSIRTQPPEGNEAEISLFGPGIGECVVIHYGDGRWLVIDSCLKPGTREPISLIYLQSIGVDTGVQVKNLLITHWHADHIIGASTVLKHCANAKLHLPAALSSKEANHLTAVYKKDFFSETDKDIADFREMMSHLFHTKRRDRLDTVHARHTFFNHVSPNRTQLIALSPSAESVTQAIANIVAHTPQEDGRRIRSIVPLSENLNAVALHFSFGGFSAVLGSDLVEVQTQNQKTGWSAIFQSDIMNELSLSRSGLYKVAHHGSSTGHHERIWNDLLDDQPVSITTAYTRSGLPTEEDIKRLKERSSQLLVTRDPNAKSKIKRDPMVDREMNAAVKDRKAINDKMGHIQIRIKASGQFEVYANESCLCYVDCKRDSEQGR